MDLNHRLPAARRRQHQPLQPRSMKEFWIGSREPREQETAVELKTSKIEKPDDTNFILGQTHFIKSVEDNLRDEADTTGAICGQLAGEYWGESGISESLRAGLARMDMLEYALNWIVGKQGQA